MASRTLFALLLVSLLAPALAHTYYGTNLTAMEGSKATGSAVYESYTHTGEFFWVLNATDVKGITSIEVVDEAGGDLIVGVTLAEYSPAKDIKGTEKLNGTFAAADINQAVAADVYELAGHVCMGHIWVRINTENGPLMGKLVYIPKKGPDSLPCEEASVPHTAHAAAPAPAPAPSPPSSATAFSFTPLLLALAAAAGAIAI